MVALNQANLSAIAARIPVPAYDRSKVTPGIVHFGVGGFHRAHQANYLDQVMSLGESMDFGIIGVGLMPSDAHMRDVMEAQDYLYTLVDKNPAGEWHARVVGSEIGYLYGPDDPRAVIEQLADPAIRIVSLTITEGGYNFDQVTGDFIADNPAIQAELVPGALPTTVFGYLYEGMKLRRERGVTPFTVMCCDNIQENGAVVKKALTSYAALRDPAFADWIASTVHFPSSMVDRITPQTTDQDRADVAERYGVEDGWPVVCESFIQWALTDDFPTGRPKYELVGVQTVHDVVPFELMKLRLLNCSHQAIAYFAQLAGIHYVHEAMADPDIRTYVRAFMDFDATPSVPPVPGEDLDVYKDTLIARFSSPAVCDTTARLAQEGSDRLPKWLIPMVKERLAVGGDIRRSAAMTAAWAKYCEAVDDSGAPITIVDNAKDSIMAAAAQQKDDPLAFLRQEQFFGDLVNDERFTKPYLWTLNLLNTVGAHGTLKALVELDG